MVYPFFDGQKLVYVINEEAPHIKNELDNNKKLTPLIELKGKTWVANQIAQYGIHATQEMAEIINEIKNKYATLQP
jgi:hypothetical protein